MNHDTMTKLDPLDTRDDGRVRVGASNREFPKPIKPPADIADEGKVRVGDGNREFPKPK